MSLAAAKRVAVVGIGNELAGDDGAGLEVIRRLTPVWAGNDQVLLAQLEGDLFAVADLIPLAAEFLFVDAVAGDGPGMVVRCRGARRAFSPSFHQTDIEPVMRSLERLGVANPFPAWDLWGVTILPPQELRAGLSPEVERAVDELVLQVNTRLQAWGLHACLQHSP